MTSSRLVNQTVACPKCGTTVCTVVLHSPDDERTNSAVLDDLMAGWEDLPGGQTTLGCTAVRALEALRADPEGTRYARLRAALGELCPHPPGQLPTPRQVGCALGRLRGRVVAGRKVQTRILHGDRLWFVQRIGSVEPSPTRR